MADNPLDKVLLEMGLDLSPIQNGGKVVLATLGDLNRISDQYQSKQQAAQNDQLAKLKQAAQAAVEAATIAVSQETRKQAALATQTKELEKQATFAKAQGATSQAAVAAEQLKITELKTETAEYAKQSAYQKAETAEIQKQITELRLKNAAQQSAPNAAPGAGGGFLSNLFGGGSSLGSIAAGGLAFGGAGAAIEALIQGAEHFITKLKDMTIESSKLTQIDDVFQRIAKGSGIDATAMLSRMQENTEGLVDKFTLTKVAVAGLNNNFKLTHTQIEQAVGDIVKLAEAHGKDAAPAIERFNRMLETGRINARGLGIGMQQAELQLRGLPNTMDAVTKKSREMAYALEQIKKRAEDLGEIPQTIAQMSRRFEVATKDLFEGFGQGVNRSAGMQVFIQIMHEITGQMESMVDTAKTIGQRVGDSFLAVGTAVQSTIPIAMALWTILKQIFAIVSNVVVPLLGLDQIGTAGSEATKRFQELHPVLKSVTDSIIDLSTQIQIMLLYLSEGLDKIQKLKQVVKHAIVGSDDPSWAERDAHHKLGESFDNASGTFRKETGKRGFWGQPLYEDPNANVGPVQSIDDKVASLKKAASDAKDNVASAMAKAEELVTKTTQAIAPPNQDPEITKQEQLKRIQLQLAYENALKGVRQSAAQERLAQQQNDIAEEQRLNDDSYSSGLKSLQEHLDAQHALAARSDANKRAQLLASHNAEMDDLDAKEKDIREKGRINGDSKKDTDLAVTAQVTLAQEKAFNSYQSKVLSQNKELAKQQADIDKKGDADKFALVKDSISRELSAKQEASRAAQGVNDKEFAKGAITPEAYTQARLQSIVATANAEIEAANKSLDAAKQFGQSKAKVEQETQDKRKSAVQKAEEDIAKLQEDYAQKYLQYVQKQYQPQQAAIETQLGTSKSGTPSEQAQVPEILSRLLTNLGQQRSALEGALSAAKPYTDTWFQIYGAIEKTYASQVKYNQELKKMADLMGPIGSGFDAIGKDIKETFTSKFAQNLGSTIESGAQQISKAKERGDIIFGRGGTPKDPAMAKLEEEATTLFGKASDGATSLRGDFDNLAAAVQRAIAALNQVSGGAVVPATSNTGDEIGAEGVPEGHNMPSGSSGDYGGEYGPAKSALATGGAQSGQAVDKMSKQFVAAADAIVGFITTITSAKSALAGIAGGGLAGAGLGSQFGPIGTAIGAAVGAALGGILGNKNAQVKNNIDQMNTTYKNVMNEFAQNTNNLQNTIIQIQALLQEARSLQSTSKKGSSEYQKSIDQYTQELQQLQTQQLQTIRDMTEQLAILSAPIGAQGMLGDLKSILDQYQKFAGAAQNATDLANANQFLVESLQNYENNLETQLNQDNTQAIQDALQLNDLLYNRTQLIQTYNNQVQGVLSQGILTRQYTRAQSAGQQIQQLTVAFNRQMEQTNEEIAATQFKVNAESQIFDLATTRVGLETQLLQLQNTQTTLDMSRILALQNLVQQLQAGDFSKGALGALLAAIPTVSSPVLGGSQNLLQALMQIAASATSSSVAGNFEDMVAAAYNDRASLGYGGFNGQNL